MPTRHHLTPRQPALVVVTPLVAPRPGHFQRHHRNRAHRILGSHTARRRATPTGVPLTIRVPFSRSRHSKLSSSSSSRPTVVIMGTQGIRGGLSKAGSNSPRHSLVHSLCPHIQYSDAHALQPPLGSGYPIQPPSQATQQPPRTGRNHGGMGLGTVAAGAGDGMFRAVPGLMLD